MKLKTKMVESSLGVKTTEDMARRIDAELKSLPASAHKLIRKSATSPDAEVQPAQRTDTSFVTTRAIDRDNEIVDPAGIELEEYRRNPIVLWGHDEDRPCGKCLWIKPDTSGHGLVAKTYYPVRPAQYQGDWLPDFVFSMVQADVLRGRSIGFLPLEWRDPNDVELAEVPQLKNVITRSLLVEYSIVSIPSNPHALLSAVGKGITFDFWNLKKIGSVKKTQPTKSESYKSLAEAVAKIKLDPAKIAEAAVRALRERWHA